MLLKELDKSIHPNIVKHTAELLLDRRGESKLYEKLEKENFTGNGLKCLRQFLQANQYNDIVGLELDLKSYILRNDVTCLFRDYCFTKKTVNIAKKLLTFCDYSTDMNKIMHLFADFFIQKSLNEYNLDSGTIGKWITASIKLFKLDKSEEIQKIVNEKGTMVNGGDDGPLSLEMLEEVEFINIHSSFNFKKDVKNIYKASLLLFPVLANKSDEVYTNIFQNYKLSLIDEHINELCTGVKAVFYPSVTRNVNMEKFLGNGTLFPRTIIDRGPIETISTYKMGTYDTRNQMCKEFHKIIGLRVTIDDVERLYELTMNLDSTCLSSNNKGTLYEHSDDTPRENDNKNKFMTILKGYISLGELIRYCKKKNIDFHSLPDDLFTSEKYTSRFNTLEECLDYYTYTSSLMLDSYNYFNGMMSNDDLYKKLEKVSNYNFLSIVDMINYAEVEVKSSKSLLEALSKLLTPSITNLKRLRAIVSNYGGAESVTNPKAWADPDYLKYIKNCCDNAVDRNAILHLYDGEDSDTKNKLALIRYADMRQSVIIHLGLMSKILNGDTIYDIAIKLGNSTLTKLPDYIEDMEDIRLIKTIKSVEIYQIGEPDYSTIKELGECYRLVFNELKSYIVAVNSEIDKITKEIEDIGISIGNELTLSETLNKLSCMIYDNGKVWTQSFNALLLSCTRRKGYLYRDHKPYRYKEYYVHEMGYLVSPDGKSVQRISESDIFT